MAFVKTQTGAEVAVLILQCVGVRGQFSLVSCTLKHEVGMMASVIISSGAESADGDDPGFKVDLKEATSSYCWHFVVL